MKNHLSRTELITDPVKYVDLLDNHRVIITRVDCPAPKLAMVTYEPKEYFIDEHPATNVVISLITTSTARLRLFEAMERILACPGAEILYTDT